MLGYYGTSCSSRCMFPYYGNGCQFHCNCTMEHCNFMSGCPSPHSYDDTSLPQILETSPAVNGTDISLPQIRETSTAMNRTEHRHQRSVPHRQSLQYTVLLTSSCILGSIFLVLAIISCAINRRSCETLLS
uniref:Uncharacterized protein LOC111103036 n=1 Tax=Crassostrea virginica TaxID=6565 RepID=A0A8B8AKQ3_CRAVI|nr:uncharacterized protein LOC111103036 [Crassostrea virginica]